MATKGIVDRITKNQSGRVLWAVKGANIAPCPFGPKPLTDIAEEMLQERGPMSPTELVVAIKETGYRPDASPQQLLATLRQSVRRYPARFAKGEDGRWSAV